MMVVGISVNKHQGNEPAWSPHSGRVMLKG